MKAVRHVQYADRNSALTHKSSSAVSKFSHVRFVRAGTSRQ